jgi:hypothetical protein
MKKQQNPIRMTICFGLICGLSFIPLSLALNVVLAGPRVICLVFWLYAAGYGLLLSRWGKNLIRSNGLPLLLLFITSFIVDSIAAYYLLSLVIVSWIRSEICFRHPHAIKLVVELLLCAFGGILVVVFPPGSAFSWMLSIWMFFLIQSLYFVIFEDRAIIRQDHHETDPFDRASRQAEAILSNL